MAFCMSTRTCRYTKALELKATAVTDVHKCMHMCDDIQVYMMGTTGALLDCEDKLGCGHDLRRCTEAGIDGYHGLRPGSLYRSGWRHVGLAGLSMQRGCGCAGISQPNSDVQCKPAHLAGPALVQAQTLQHLCQGCD